MKNPENRSREMLLLKDENVMEFRRNMLSPTWVRKFLGKYAVFSRGALIGIYNNEDDWKKDLRGVIPQRMHLMYKRVTTPESETMFCFVTMPGVNED